MNYVNRMTMGVIYKLTNSFRIGWISVVVAVLLVTSVSPATRAATTITETTIGKSPTTLSCFPIKTDRPDF